MPTGLSESEYKVQAERILREIRGIKLEGLKADRDKEQWITKRKQKAVEVEQERYRQEEIRLSIEQTKSSTLRENLTEAKLNLEIAQVGVSATRDKLSFEKQAADLNRDLFRQRLQSLDLTLGEATFNNDDRRQEFKVKEINTGLPRSFSFADRN
ncbi:MAG TPA: hypothetical protein V6C65_03100 [Allocoleopsis sp.]